METRPMLVVRCVAPPPLLFFNEGLGERKMGQKQIGRYCNHCERDVMATKTTPSHVLHGMLTFFTAGVWGIVWMILYFKENYRCTECGMETSGCISYYKK